MSKDDNSFGEILPIGGLAAMFTKMLVFTFHWHRTSWAKGVSEQLWAGRIAANCSHEHWTTIRFGIGRKSIYYLMNHYKSPCFTVIKSSMVSWRTLLSRKTKTAEGLTFLPVSKERTYRSEVFALSASMACVRLRCFRSDWSLFASN